VLEETDGGVEVHGVQHVGENGGHGVESLRGRADVVQAHVVEQHLLDDERSHRFGPVFTMKLFKMLYERLHRKCYYKKLESKSSPNT